MSDAGSESESGGDSRKSPLRQAEQEAYDCEFCDMHTKQWIEVDERVCCYACLESCVGKIYCTLCQFETGAYGRGSGDDDVFCTKCIAGLPNRSEPAIRVVATKKPKK